MVCCVKGICCSASRAPHLHHSKLPHPYPSYLRGSNLPTFLTSEADTDSSNVHPAKLYFLVTKGNCVSTHQQHSCYTGEITTPATTCSVLVSSSTPCTCVHHVGYSTMSAYAVATTNMNTGTASTTCSSPTRLLSIRRCHSGLGAPASGGGGGCRWGCSAVAAGGGSVKGWGRRGPSSAAQPAAQQILNHGARPCWD